MATPGEQKMLDKIIRHRVLILCVLLAAVTFVVYLPVRNHEFVRYDDDKYITENPNVLSGLTLENIKWAFTAGHESNWHPLTWLSHQLDCMLFGKNAGAHHLVNVVYHVANTLLLFIVFGRMTKRIWPSAFIAALFALHPLHIESVAWAAERKDVLSTFLWLLTMLAYVRYAERPSIVRYLSALVLFALGLMAKPMLVTLPFILLLLDYWPLERFGDSKTPVRKLILEKLPFVFLSTISSIITVVAQQKGGAMLSVYNLPMKERIINAAVSYLGYIGKMIWPRRLAVLYPHPVNGTPVSRAVIFGTILIVITTFIIYHGRRHKYLILGWLWYLGALVPVIGIIQVGAQAMADRYTYIPLTGLFVIIAFGVADIFRNVPFKNIILAVAAASVLCACTIMTSIQLKFWKDSVSLFEHTLDAVENNYVIQNNYGNILNELNRPGEAVKYYEEAIKALPRAPDIHNNLGNALRDTGKIDEAIRQYKIALEIDPDFSIAHLNLALALAAKGEYDEAVMHYKKHIGPDADTSKLYHELGTILVRHGNIEEAIKQFKKGLYINPDSVEILCDLGLAEAKNGRPAEAIEYYKKALQIDPNEILAHGRLALAYAALGRIDESIEQVRLVLAAQPDDYEMHTNLGKLLEAKGQFEQAEEAYKRALKINPDYEKARERLSTLTQKQGNQ